MPSDLAARLAALEGQHIRNEVIVALVAVAEAAEKRRHESGHMIDCGARRFGEAPDHLHHVEICGDPRMCLVPDCDRACIAERTALDALDAALSD